MHYVFIESGRQCILVTSIAKDAVEPNAPCVQIVIIAYYSTMIITCGDHLNLETILREELNFLRNKGMVNISVSESANFLSIHPIEVACFATITPSIHVSIFGQRKRVILSHRYIDNFVILETFDHLGLFEVYIIFVAMAEHTPITLSKGP